MKRLLLLRHAKAEQARKDTPEDRDRVLTERGRRDAPRIGEAMRFRGYLPDLILCSPSKRTRETLELVAIGAGVQVEFREEIYLAGGKRIFGLVQNLPDRIRNPLIVGHNPGLEDCATLLTGAAGKADLRKKFDSLAEKFPVCALAVLDFDISLWNELRPHQGKFADFIRPTDLDEN